MLKTIFPTARDYNPTCRTTADPDPGGLLVSFPVNAGGRCGAGSGEEGDDPPSHAQPPSHPSVCRSSGSVMEQCSPKPAAPFGFPAPEAEHWDNRGWFFLTSAVVFFFLSVLLLFLETFHVFKVCLLVMGFGEIVKPWRFSPHQ